MEKPRGHPLKDAIQQENQERQRAYDADVDARTKAITDSLKDLGGLLMREGGRFLREVGEMARDKWNQGRDELGKALMHGHDGFMPWPEHDKPEAPAVEPPAHQAIEIEPPRPYVPRPIQEEQKPLTM